MTKRPRFRKLYTKISIDADTQEALDEIKLQIRQNPEKTPSYNTAIKHLLKNVPKSSSSPATNTNSATESPPKYCINLSSSYFIPTVANPLFSSVPKSSSSRRPNIKNMIDINPDIIYQIIAGIAAIIAALTTHKTISQDKILTGVKDAMNPDLPQTPEQTKALEILPETSWQMSTLTKNQIFTTLQAAAPQITWDNFLYQIESMEKLGALSYAITTTWDYADTRKNTGVFVEYGLIKAFGTAKEVTQLAEATRSTTIMVV